MSRSRRCQAAASAGMFLLCLAIAPSSALPSASPYAHPSHRGRATWRALERAPRGGGPGLHGAPSTAPAPTMRLKGGLAGGGSFPGGRGPRWTPPRGMDFGRGGMADLGFGSWQVPNLGTPASMAVPIAGIAALALSGLYMSKGAPGKSWDKTTTKRIRATFGFFALSIAVWAASAVVFWKTGLVPTHPLHIFGVFGATIFCMYKIASLDYDRDKMKKSAWFVVFTALQGVNLSVILLQLAARGLLYLAVQAGAITAADLLAVSVVIAAFPNQNWLWLRGLLSTGMGLLLGANLVNLMLGNRVLHMGLAYVGAAMFTVALLYDAQKVMRDASIPPGTVRRIDAQGRPLAEFDPLQHAMNIYMDAINLFMYILRALIDQEERSQQGGGDRRQRRRSDNPRPPLGLRPGPPSDPQQIGLRKGVFG